jgi:hypothetical protein
MSVVDASFDHPLKLEEKAASPLAGGIVNYGYQCGMLWGAALAAGAQAYQMLGSGPRAETSAIITTQRLVDIFRDRNKNEINCLEITDLNMRGKTQLSMQEMKSKTILKFLVKGGPIYCLRMAAGYAREAYSEINTILSEIQIEASPPPVSCAAMLAQKMGISEMYAVMAAGFAGGIGLSGGACGALGAAIWINGMIDPLEQSGIKLTNPRIENSIERFLESSDFEFECSKIVGRRFGNINDHASYLHNGGCSKIIESLAAS